MHLTQLTLDSRHTAIRRDLGNAYDMHRTLARAFATQPDAPPERFLWRLDALDALTGRAVVLIQSNGPGVWNHLPTSSVQVREKSFDPLRSPSLASAASFACWPTPLSPGRASVMAYGKKPPSAIG